MKLNEAGIGHFVREVDEEEEVPDYLATSPLPATANKVGYDQWIREQRQAPSHTWVDPR
jgi:hypothetical protein